ncbi:anti-sigma factor [Planktotalea sp.]|uniref:anti-sigma factor n=1 Tax=Planktotalea sp. TaxID=2029877 RepID=UPI00329825BD
MCIQIVTVQMKYQEFLKLEERTEVTDEDGIGAHGSHEQSDLARQFVLGVLEGQELRDFKKLLKSDPKAQADVAHWREQFTALGMDIDTPEATATVLGHLKRELWSENRLPWRRRMRIWEFALGGIGAALLAYWVASSSEQQAQIPDVLRAEMSVADTEYHLRVALIAGTNLLRFEQTGAPLKEGRVHALWLMSSAEIFETLGVLPAAPVGAIKLSAAQLEWIESGARLALSREAIGGAQSSRPSDPIMAIAVFDAAARE